MLLKPNLGDVLSLTPTPDLTAHFSFPCSVYPEELFLPKDSAFEADKDPNNRRKLCNECQHLKLHSETN